MAAILKLFLAAFGDVRARPDAGHALRRRAAERGGVRLRDVLRRLAGVAADQRLRVHPVDAGADRAPDHGGPAADGRAGSPRSSACSSWAAIPSRASTWCSSPSCSSLSGVLLHWRGGPRIRRGRWSGPTVAFAIARHRRRGAGRARARAVRRVPAALRRPLAARPRQRPATGRASTSARCSCTTTGAGRRRSTSSRSCRSAAGTPARATLMLAAAALLLRRTAERIAVVGVRAVLRLHGRRASRRSSGSSAGLPGFSAAHNERLLIYFLLCLALLAGWGLDDLSAGRFPARPSRRAVLLGRGAIFCVPVVWMLAAGTLEPRRARLRPAGRLGLRASAGAAAGGRRDRRRRPRRSSGTARC